MNLQYTIRKKDLIHEKFIIKEGNIKEAKDVIFKALMKDFKVDEFISRNMAEKASAEAIYGNVSMYTKRVCFDKDTGTSISVKKLKK